MTEQESRFHKDMLNTCQIAKQELGYRPSRFLQLLTELGGVQAAKRLIAKQGESYGLEVLWQGRRLDLSMEVHVIKPEYQSLFTSEEVQRCREVLDEMGYED